MNKKFFSLLVLIMIVWVKGQDKADYRLRAFASLDLTLASDTRVIKKDVDYTWENALAYGVSAQVGYQPLTWFGFSTGPRYDYIVPNNHILYWGGKGYFFVTPPEDEDFGFVSLNFGKQMNRNVNGTDGFLVGISVGKIMIEDYHLAHKFELKFEYHSTYDKGFPMLGLSYGLVLFSNKTLE